MVRAGTGLSGAAAAGAAAEDAMAAARLSLAGAAPSFVVLLATVQHAGALDDAIAEALRGACGAPVMGALVDGLSAGGQEIEDAPGVAVLMASGVLAHAVAVHDPAHGANEGLALLHALGRAPSDDDLLLVLFDPAARDLRTFAAGVRDAAGPALAVGAGVADAGDGAARVFAGDEVVKGGLAGLWLRGAARPRGVVTASCRPSGGPHVVTRCEGHWVLALDGRPALDVYREAARGPLSRDLRRALDFVLAVLPAGPSPRAFPAFGLARHLAGVSEERRAFALPEPVSRGQSLAFAFRDGGGAREDLREALAELAPIQGGLGFHVSCRERGEALFGVTGLEAAYVARALPGVPMLGCLAACEVGPVGGEASLLTHASVTVRLPG